MFGEHTSRKKKTHIHNTYKYYYPDGSEDPKKMCQFEPWTGRRRVSMSVGYILSRHMNNRFFYTVQAIRLVLCMIVSDTILVYNYIISDRCNLMITGARIYTQNIHIPVYKYVKQKISKQRRDIN